jgi:hypothetical protein
VSPGELDRDRIERFLDRAARELTGRWVVVGGAAAAVWFAAERTTQDIDIIGSDGTNAERLHLLEVADAEGLPIETVNTGADYYVRRTAGWDTEVIELRRGANATIYRPTATMYLLLKLARLSEQDLDDCLALLAWCAATGEPIDRARIAAALTASAGGDAVRRARLAEALGGRISSSE